MLIQVQYTDGRHDMVKPQLLDRLLDAHKLAGFQRHGGWVTVGKDPIRRRLHSVGSTSVGLDRRDSAQR